MAEPLTITTSPREDHQLDLTIQLGAERTEQALQRSARQVAKRANVPGFRRGHAPYAAVLRTYGRETLLNEVLDELGQEVYSEALDQEHIEPYSQAALVDVQTDPVTFKLVVPLEPEVDLGDYHSIRLPAPEVSVTEEDVDTLIEQRRNQEATWADIERPAQIGDMVVVDIKGTVGEDTIMDNHDWELILKEESGWLPGFDQSFVGMSAGEEKDFTLRYPEDSTSRYKGQEATFHAALKKVRVHIQPEITDEWAKTQGDYQGMADLRAKLLENLTQQRQAEAEAKLSDDAVRALVEHAVKLVYPPVVVEESLDSMVHDLEHRLSDIGYKLDDYLKLQGTNIAAYREQMRPQAEERAKGRLALNKLAQVEDIDVTPAEISARAAEMLQGAEDDPQANGLRELLASEQGQMVIRQELLGEKTLARLRAIVTGQPETTAATEPEATAATEGEAAPAEALEPGGEVEPAIGESVEGEAGAARQSAAEAPSATTGSAETAPAEAPGSTVEPAIGESETK